MGLGIVIDSPANGASVSRSFTITGRAILVADAPGQQTALDSVQVTFGTNGPTQTTDFMGAPSEVISWHFTGQPFDSVAPGSTITVSVLAKATFTLITIVGGKPHTQINHLTASATVNVALPAAIPPVPSINAIPTPTIAPSLPLQMTFSGNVSSPEAPVTSLQYNVSHGQVDPNQFHNVSVGPSPWSLTLPVPPSENHVLTIRATDAFGITGTTQATFAVRPQNATPPPPGTRTTLTGVPTTSSVTTWTRLEPSVTNADMSTGSAARLFDPLWLLARQWQMGEFQAEDAGTPVQARVRATNALITRCHLGGLGSNPPGTGTQSTPYNPAATPLEALVTARRMRPGDSQEPRMLMFSVEAGLHFLRMLEQQGLSKSYRNVFIAKLALQPPPPAEAASIDDATARYIQSMVGRAPDGRVLAGLVRPDGGQQTVLDTTLAIAAADQGKVLTACQAWLTWYDSICSEPAAGSPDAWYTPRIEYSASIAARFSATDSDAITFTADEFDGTALDWSSFDTNTQMSLSTTGDSSMAALVEATVPAPITIQGVPAPRFWEMEDAQIAYGLVPVGPTDIAHLMVIEYASTYGNDWFVVPLTIPVGSVTRVDSLVVTDSFGVRSLLRPLGDPALPPPNFSMWQSANIRAPGAAAPSPSVAANRFLFPPTLGRRIEGPALEEVHFMRDEMANMAWAIERSTESPLEQPAQRNEASDASAPPPAVPASSSGLPQYLLSSTVPPNWIPLLPVQLNTTVPGSTATQTITRLQRGAVLQPDGSQKVNSAQGDLLNAASPLMFYDEEIPRDGIHVTRQRVLTRWTDGSTWLWTSWRNNIGQGEGSSGLQFDQVLEPTGSST